MQNAAGLSHARTLAIVVGFALVTPAGLAIGSWLLTDLSAAGGQIFAAIAAGTFLYVALFDLVPEVFHERRDVATKIALLVVGVAASVLLRAY